MGLCGEVHDCVGFEIREDPVQPGAVADIDLFKPISGIARNRGERIEIAGVGEFIHHADFVRGFPDEHADDRGPDESGSAGYNDFPVHESFMFLQMNCLNEYSAFQFHRFNIAPLPRSDKSNRPKNPFFPRSRENGVSGFPGIISSQPEQAENVIKLL